MKPCCAESYAEYRDMTDREEYEELVSGILSMSATDSGIVSVGETVVTEEKSLPQYLRCSTITGYKKTPRKNYNKERKKIIIAEEDVI